LSSPSTVQTPNTDAKWASALAHVVLPLKMDVAVLLTEVVSVELALVVRVDDAVVVPELVAVVAVALALEDAVDVAVEVCVVEGDVLRQRDAVHVPSSMAEVMFFKTPAKSKQLPST